MKTIRSTAAVLLLTFAVSACALNARERTSGAPAPAPSVTSLLGVSVQGADYPTLCTFKGRLQALPGVEKVYQQSFSLQDRSVIQVEYAGNAQRLADALQSLASKERPLHVLRFDPSQIDVELNAK